MFRVTDADPLLLLWIVGGDVDDLRQRRAAGVTCRRCFGKWSGVHARFRRWSHAGVWERLFHAFADTPDFEYVLIDSTVSKVHADAAGAKGGLKLPRSAGLAVA